MKFVYHQLNDCTASVGLEYSTAGVPSKNKQTKQKSQLILNFTFPKFKIVSKAFRVPCDFKPEEKYCMKNVNHRIKCFSFSCKPGYKLR